MIRTTRLIAACLCLAIGVARASLREGPYTYTVTAGRATITRFDQAFSGALSITNRLGGCPVTHIGWEAFAWCRGLTSVTIPDSVTQIGDSAFYMCTGLTSVTIGNDVTHIGNSAFYGCSGLTSVTIGNGVTHIGSAAFFHCWSLTSVTIPDSVTQVGNWAFWGCNSLTSVMIGNSVTSIGDWAFRDCTALTSVTIPGSVTQVGRWAFAGCDSLQRGFFAGHAPSMGQQLFGNTPATIYYMPGAAGWETTFAERPVVLWNPTFAATTAVPEGHVFTITGTPGIPIGLQARTNLLHGAWEPVVSLTNLPASGTWQFQASITPEETPTRFYRVIGP